MLNCVPKLRFNIVLQYQTLFFSTGSTLFLPHLTSDVLSIHMSFQIGFFLKFIGVTDQRFLLALPLVSPFVLLGVFHPSVKKQTI